MSTPQKARVLNLIRNIDLSKASPKKRAIIKLLEWQPLARRIRFAGRCHCRRGQLLSYQLDSRKDVGGLHEGEEPCGYYCPSCGFGNAGARESHPPRQRVGR